MLRRYDRLQSQKKQSMADCSSIKPPVKNLGEEGRGYIIVQPTQETGAPVMDKDIGDCPPDTFYKERHAISISVARTQTNSQSDYPYLYPTRHIYHQSRNVHTYIIYIYTACIARCPGVVPEVTYTPGSLQAAYYVGTTRTHRSNPLSWCHVEAQYIVAGNHHHSRLPFSHTTAADTRLPR